MGPVTHAAPYSPLGGLPRGSLVTSCRQRWSGAPAKTGHRSEKTHWSHLFLATPTPIPRRGPRVAFRLSHQGSQGEKQSKEHGHSARRGAWRFCWPQEGAAADPRVPKTSQPSRAHPEIWPPGPRN